MLGGIQLNQKLLQGVQGDGFLEKSPPAAARDVHVKILPRQEAFKIPNLIRTKINLRPLQIEEVRTIEIEGLDLQADGGTHVANTREVGTIRAADYRSKGKINKCIWLEISG